MGLGILNGLRGEVSPRRVDKDKRIKKAAQDWNVNHMHPRWLRSRRLVKAGKKSFPFIHNDDDVCELCFDKIMKIIKTAGLISLLLLVSAHALAKDENRTATSSDCADMEVWDYGMNMCMPLAMKDMPMSMLMLHGNAFLVGVTEEDDRGRNKLAAPNMIMLDAGTSVGDRQYFNVDLMLTAEKWTFPKDGYPELLQIGEENSDHVPYLDAQHPHSSPIMGLIFSDTITLDENKNHLKISFAPRGETTEGPVAFMHRATGEVNPDAPLGHHIGQDVGHISSTVLAASLKLGKTTLQASTFYGEEPKPDVVDLPMGSPNSYAARLIQEFSSDFYAMASAAYVKNPEADEPELDHIWRYSASVYHHIQLNDQWHFWNTFIYGLVNDYDHASALKSFGEEFLFQKTKSQIWGRIEYLQRTPNELEVTGFSDGDAGRWVTALTLGYTQTLVATEALQFKAGASVTKDLLPAIYQDAYGIDPWSGKIFLQISGMKMWDL